MRWTTVALTLGFFFFETAYTQETTESFLQACTDDAIDLVRAALDEHPDWLQVRSSHGETCLHVAGIYGASAVTLALLQAGADPNVRSTYEQGLRMHPLSWNVYGGHVANVKLLLEYGADPNLDVDHMESGAPETVLDIVQRIVGAFEENYKNSESNNEDSRYAAFREIQEVLLKHGAKSYAALTSAKVTHTEL